MKSNELAVRIVTDLADYERVTAGTRSSITWSASRRRLSGVSSSRRTCCQAVVRPRQLGLIERDILGPSLLQHAQHLEAELPQAGSVHWRAFIPAAIDCSVSEFLDVPGASGTAYRFRRAELDALPNTAGNLLVVTGARSSRRYLLCAAARSLGRATAEVQQSLATTRGATLFIRLNVARSVREAEHADIIAAVKPETALSDLD